MAATPMAMPERGQAGPELAGAQPDAWPGGPGPKAAASQAERSRSRSSARPGQRRAGDDAGSVKRAIAAVSATMRPSSISICRGMRVRDVLVVGDDHDGDPAVVQFVEERQDRLAGRLVEVAGGLVGEHDGRLPDQGPGDGDTLALAT